jgi:hypothetical protein
MLPVFSILQLTKRVTDPLFVGFTGTVGKKKGFWTVFLSIKLITNNGQKKAYLQLLVN